MTPQQIEALKLALEALEGFYEYGYDRQECFEHITAIKEALLEHAMQKVQRLGQEIEQEPAGWEVGVVDGVVTRRLAPPQRKPLTDDLYNELLFAVGNKCPNETRHQTALRYILQAEKGDEKAAHGIKGDA